MKDSVINHVQTFRKTAGITQEDLANYIGITRQTLIAIEKGNYTPSVALALKFAYYFDTTVELLFELKK